MTHLNFRDRVPRLGHGRLDEDQDAMHALAFFDQLHPAISDGQLDVASAFAHHILARLAENTDGLDRHMTKQPLHTHTGGARVVLHSRIV